ncbi:MAG: glypican [Synechococcaceae cyanobacterium]|nr:glypican [Synechococcaceae cyanobacterium]
MAKPVLRLHPIAASLVLLCSGVGALVLGTLALFAIVPVLFGVGLLACWILAILLVAWGGIESLAALERWMERDARFRR